MYRSHTFKQTHPTLAEHLKLLQLEIRRFSKVFIVVDALDECSENDGIRGFFPEVRKLLLSIHLLVTSRHIANIEREFERAIRSGARASDEDIKNYLMRQIEGQPQLLRHIKVDPTLQNAILNTIVQKANGMYVSTTIPCLY